MKSWQRIACLFIAAPLLLVSAPSLADPPPHAKAHGWRKKNDPNYPGYTGRQWTSDYGVVSMGRCNTDAVLTAVGGAVGGVIGAGVADRNGSDRTIGILIGGAVGAVIGNRIGRELDRTDQACIGHALELVQPGKTVRWNNSQTGVAYELVPVRNIGNDCREFRLVAKRGEARQATAKTACSRGDGRWELRS